MAGNVRELANHPGVFMREDAAIQFDLFETNHGIIGINRAMVSEASQQALINRWDKGGVFNRPPYLYEPKRPPKASDHVQGDAFDTSDITHTLTHIGPYGFYRNYEWDKPHFKFDPARVRVRPVVPTMKGVGMIEQLVNINGKTYGLGFAKVKHLGPEQQTDVVNTTGMRVNVLNDNRRLEAFSNLLDYYGVEPGVLDDNGFVYDPFAEKHVEGGLWSEDRATRAELRKLAKRVK